MTAVLADTSAWIAYQRAAGSPVSVAVRHAVDTESVVTTDLVIAEMLAGLAPERVDEWTGLFAFAQHLPQRPWDDALAAAEVYRRCRQGGETPRSIVDCMIAAVAIRNDVAVLHDDRDYDAIARHTDLQVAQP